MTHVHFDLAEVEATLRLVHGRFLAEEVATLRGPAREIADEASACFEAVLQMVLLTPRLRNTGRDDEFIAHVAGSVLANMMLNVICASADRGMSVEIIGRRIDRMLQVAGGDPPEGTMLGQGTVTGTRGARA